MVYGKMKASAWKKKIKTACLGIQTYREEFDPLISTLADILENRDKVYDQFVASGGNAVIRHTNKAGRTNLAKNPLLVAWMELNSQALIYWRDLGLTPSGYRKLTEDGKITPKERKLSLFDAISKAVE